MTVEPRQGLPKFIAMKDGRWVPALFKINSRDEQGRPLDCTLCHSDIPVEAANGDEFLMVYVSEKVTSR